jgi:5-methylcytosine-specific restriction enzyme A
VSGKESRCPKHLKQREDDYNERRGSSTKRGYDYRWQRLRDYILKKRPCCELCDERNIIKAGEEVHHKIPLSQGGTHAEDNLLVLCKSCHSRLTAKAGRWG